MANNMSMHDISYACHSRLPSTQGTIKMDYVTVGRLTKPTFLRALATLRNSGVTVTIGGESAGLFFVDYYNIVLEGPAGAIGNFADFLTELGS